MSFITGTSLRRTTSIHIIDVYIHSEQHPDSEAVAERLRPSGGRI